MAIVVLTHEIERPPIDGPLEQAALAAQKASKALRLRVQPDLYDPDKNRYTSWTGLTWMVDLEDVAEGRKLREALTLFFRLFGEDADKLRRVLQDPTDPT